MRQKPHHPDKGFTGKKTYYDTRGRTHLINPETTTEGYMKTDHPRAWCGVRLENCNHTTSEVPNCTCQKCLMVATRSWGGRDRKCGGGDVTQLIQSERKLNALRKP